MFVFSYICCARYVIIVAAICFCRLWFREKRSSILDGSRQIGRKPLDGCDDTLVLLMFIQSKILLYHVVIITEKVYSNIEKNKLSVDIVEV